MNKEAMIHNIHTHIALMQLQLNVIIQDNNLENIRPENNMIILPIVTQNAPTSD